VTVVREAQLEGFEKSAGAERGWKVGRPVTGEAVVRRLGSSK
jgi:hypothetical protein